VLAGWGNHVAAAAEVVDVVQRAVPTTQPSRGEVVMPATLGSAAAYDRPAGGELEVMAVSERSERCYGVGAINVQDIEAMASG
jgi:hypothetical protein